jgi:hypothetical protein
LLSQPGRRKAAGLLAVRSKPKDSGERAAQFNQQLTVFRDQADFLDQPAKRLSGLRPEFRPVQFLVQALNPLTVQMTTHASECRWYCCTNRITHPHYYLLL